MKAQSGKAGKGSGGRKFSELPGRITKTPAKKQAAGALTYTGPRKTTKKK